MRFFFLFSFIFLQIAVQAQINTRVKSTKDQDSLARTNSITDTTSFTPESRNPDNPFIDYKPAVIYLTSSDSIEDHAYIRQNFTDQMVSVWSKPNRLYPASKIYGLRMDGKLFRAVRKSAYECVFAERAVHGPMSLYIYTRIPQSSGWVECYSAGGYTNNMIVENKVTRNKNSYGYFVSLYPDTNNFIAADDINKFAESYLKDMPETYKQASPFLKIKRYKAQKQILTLAMLVGVGGVAFIDSNMKWLFLAGFPVAAILTFINRSHIPDWKDMVAIVNSYNRETLTAAGQ
ncbi:MAG TPA: hypothetical protein PLJ84_00645 [Bacteroidales bacterium]|nr:hypothetical protein [Bacteroidales bacterium]HPT01078.1 hypothetical protein [Bacteroidales bacterium]